MKKNITIHDLAKALDIDSSTVSRALNDSPRVGIKTKEKVLKLAKEMGYQRNMMASNLRTNKTMTIGVIVPHISRHFFSGVIDGIEQIASGRDYRVIISQSRDDHDIEKKLVDGMYMNRIDGLLISPTQDTRDGDHLKVFTDQDIPVVLFDRYYENSNLSKVVLDDRKATYIITDHLISQGRKDIVQLAGALSSAMYKQRFHGYRDALLDNDIAYRKDYVKSIELTSEGAVTAIKEILDSSEPLPNAILCVNDITALAVMKYLDENTDIKVPEDIAVAGFSNELASGFIKPGLTTIDQHSFDMGTIATEMLFEFIKAKGDQFKANRTIVVKPDLIIRGSTMIN